MCYDDLIAKGRRLEVGGPKAEVEAECQIEIDEWHMESHK